jgi:hypothetical protein
MTSSEEPKVFISYRREETAGHAGRLYDVMSSRFGDTNVFMDVDIAPGVDFVSRITQAVGACHVLLVVIGPRWTTIGGGARVPRLAEPGDFVRLEVEEGLRRAGVTVIPLLVGGARMPEPAELPPPLRPLSRRNALELSDSRWRYDVDRLLAALERLLGVTSPAATPATPDGGSRLLRLHPGSLALGVIVGSALAGLGGRAIADVLRWGPTSDGGKVMQPVLLQGLTWAVIGAAIALVLGARRLTAVLGGALVGTLAGAAPAALVNIPRFLVHPAPQESTLEALTVVGLGVTGALIGALVGWLWARRASAGVVSGLAAGVVLQLVLNATAWDGSRVAHACLEAVVIVGFTVLTQVLMDARAARYPGALAA